MRENKPSHTLTHTQPDSAKCSSLRVLGVRSSPRSPGHETRFALLSRVWPSLRLLLLPSAITTRFTTKLTGWNCVWKYPWTRGTGSKTCVWCSIHQPSARVIRWFRVSASLGRGQALHLGENGNLKQGMRRLYVCLGGNGVKDYYTSTSKDGNKKNIQIYWILE